MNYIFVFLGEFGYEVLNWQGAVRKFSRTLSPQDEITICSRKGLNPFYECATRYIDISRLPYFKRSAANMYWSHNPEINLYARHEQAIKGELPWETFSKKDRCFQNKLKREIIACTLKELGFTGLKKFFYKKYCRFVFSSDYQTINGVEFGSPDFEHSFIYKDLKLYNNDFTRIEPPAEAVKTVQEKLGFALSEPFVLCQTGARAVIERSKYHLQYQAVEALSKHIKVVLLNFDTGRNLDSKSVFPELKNCFIFTCSSFEEQAVLIAHAKNCLFFTEGDFRSHNYLPPFMGKNVYSVADKSVFELGTTPIDFWNKNVFTFGGQIIPIYTADLSTPQQIAALTQKIVA